MTVPIETAVQDFLRDCGNRNLSERTIVTYIYVLKPLVRRLRGRYIDDIPAQEIIAYLAELRAQKSRYRNASQRREVKGRLSVETQRSRIRQLKVFFNWCVGSYRLSPAVNPMLNVRMPGASLDEPKAISMDDVSRLLSVCDESPEGRRNRAIIFFLVDTGARAAGVCGLTLDRLDLAAGKATLVEKGYRSRSVPISAQTVDAIHEWLLVRPAEAESVFCGLGGSRESIYYADVLKPGGLHQLLNRLARRAGVVGPHNPHSFRHAFAKEALRNGATIAFVARVLGQDPRTTMMYYLRWTEGEIAEQHERFTPLRRLKQDVSPKGGE